LCFFSNLTGQFILTSRASIYSEAYQDKVLDHDQLYNNKLVPNHPDASKVIANSSRSLGHDVKGEKWAIVYENIKNFPMPEDERIRIFVDMERLFYDNIVKPEMDISSNSRANIKSPLYYNTTKPMTDDVIPNNEFVIITTKFSNREQQEDALQEFELIESTTSHERLHARYFLDKKYETTVDEYIDNKVSKDDMEFFLWSLEARGYVNIRYDDYLRRNEFMAYTLMYYNYDCGYRRIASDIMRNMVDYLQTKYKNDFIAYLKNNGVSPVE
ncbi:MAG: hypothetical protein NTY22_08545, partial [Proteobacteria bacterium]|nr:hypothetical protein [Pseudomonadota bacterium]